MTKDKKLSRRQFLQIVAISTTAGISLKLGLDALQENEIISETRLLMGTFVNIKAVGSDSQAAISAISASFDRMALLESVLSRFLPDSQLSKLNQTGILHDAHPALIELISQSHELSRMTTGAFDITVKPLLDLYQSNLSLPSDKQILETLPLVNYQNLNLEANTVSLKHPGMAVTLDGIAKGYIVSEGVEELERSGFSNVLVEAGGDLMALGEKSAGSPWKIGVQSPRQEIGSQNTTIYMKNQAVATSGDYLQAFTTDYAHHHIIDPRKGYSSPEFASVSIVAQNVTMADGLATAVMVMGDAGLQLIEDIEACEAYVVTKDAIVLKTSGFE